MTNDPALYGGIEGGTKFVCVVMASADQALYAAKQSGRNQVMLAPASQLATDQIDLYVGSRSSGPVTRVNHIR